MIVVLAHMGGTAGYQRRDHRGEIADLAKQPGRGELHRLRPFAHVKTEQRGQQHPDHPALFIRERPRFGQHPGGSPDRDQPSATPWPVNSTYNLGVTPDPTIAGDGRRLQRNDRSPSRTGRWEPLPDPYCETPASTSSRYYMESAVGNLMHRRPGLEGRRLDLPSPTRAASVRTSRAPPDLPLQRDLGTTSTLCNPLTTRSAPWI